MRGRVKGERNAREGKKGNEMRGRVTRERGGRSPREGYTIVKVFRC